MVQYIVPACVLLLQRLCQYIQAYVAWRLQLQILCHRSYVAVVWILQIASIMPEVPCAVAWLLQYSIKRARQPMTYGMNHAIARSMPMKTECSLSLVFGPAEADGGFENSALGG